MPSFTLTIAGTGYTASQRASNRIHMGAIERILDMGYDELTFAQVGLGMASTWHPSQSIVLDDGATRFQGEIVTVSFQQIPKGWVHGYRCLNIRYQADRVPITYTDGTGTAIYNRDPSDPYYLPSLAGLTVGEILTLVLCIPDTATALAAIGIQYASLSPPTLAAQTVTDFAALDAVPMEPVILQGEAIVNQLAQFAEKWHPQFALGIDPDGTIRARDMTDIGVGQTFEPKTLTIPGSSGKGDAGVCWPTFSRSTESSATQVIVRGGPETEGAWLSWVDGTIAPAWSGGDEASWTLYDFTQPKDATDTGNINSMTSTSITVTSDDATKTWATNFWNGRQAVVFLYNLATAGISQNETRVVVSNTSLSAAGTATISWDSSWPVTLTNYTRYRIVGTASGLVDVGRLWDVVEPHTGDTGLDTFIGAHLVPRSAFVVRVANNDKTFGEYYASTGYVLWSSSGSPPFVNIPWTVEPVPATGQFRFTQPVVSAFGQASYLQGTGYPTTAANGLPGDVQILAIYSRGALSVQQPGSGYSGTAYTVDGLQVTKYLDFPDWLWKLDATSMGTIAEQHLLSLQDTVVEGTGVIYGVPSVGGIGDFDPLDFGVAINYALDGGTSPLSAANAPIRGVRLSWNPSGGETIFMTEIHFSTRRKAFSADKLYLHPQFAPGSPLMAATGAGTGWGGGGAGFAGLGTFSAPAGGGMEGGLADIMGRAYSPGLGMAGTLGGATPSMATPSMGTPSTGTPSVGDMMSPGGSQGIDPGVLAFGMGTGMTAREAAQSQPTAKEFAQASGMGTGMSAKEFADMAGPAKLEAQQRQWAPRRQRATLHGNLSMSAKRAAQAGAGNNDWQQSMSEMQMQANRAAGIRSGDEPSLALPGQGKRGKLAPAITDPGSRSAKSYEAPRLPRSRSPSSERMREMGGEETNATRTARTLRAVDAGVGEMPRLGPIEPEGQAPSLAEFPDEEPGNIAELP